MTQLNFSLQNGKYVAEATVNADFAIHLEREKNGLLEFYLSSVENGRKVPFFIAEYSPYSPDFDADFDDIVYPKYLKIVSSTPVQLGYIKEND